DPDGRAVLGARPDRDGEDRGAHRRVAGELLHRHGDALDATGGASMAEDGVLPPRRTDRGGRYSRDLHEPEEQANPGLHHGPLRLRSSGKGLEQWRSTSCARTRRSWRSWTGESPRWVGWPRMRSARRSMRWKSAIRGLRRP